MICPGKGLFFGEFFSGLFGFFGFFGLGLGRGKTELATEFLAGVGGEEFVEPARFGFLVF